MLGVFSLNTFGLKCAGEFDYVDYIYGVTIFPMFILGFFYACYRRYDIHRFLDETIPEVDSQTKQCFQDKVVGLAIVFFDLILPAVTCAIFRMFPCQVSVMLLTVGNGRLLIPELLMYISLDFGS